MIGTDISPIQPAFVPPNCRFELDDAQLEWTFQPNTFDFIHVRALHGGIDDWPTLYGEIFRFVPQPAPAALQFFSSPPRD